MTEDYSQTADDILVPDRFVYLLIIDSSHCFGLKTILCDKNYIAHVQKKACLSLVKVKDKKSLTLIYLPLGIS